MRVFGPSRSSLDARIVQLEAELARSRRENCELGTRYKAALKALELALRRCNLAWIKVTIRPEQPN